jgi:hypothetical protein
VRTSLSLLYCIPGFFFLMCYFMMLLIAKLCIISDRQMNE